MSEILERLRRCIFIKVEIIKSGFVYERCPEINAGRPHMTTRAYFWNALYFDGLAVCANGSRKSVSEHRQTHSRTSKWTFGVTTETSQTHKRVSRQGSFSYLVIIAKPVYAVLLRKLRRESHGTVMCDNARVMKRLPPDARLDVIYLIPIALNLISCRNSSSWLKTELVPIADAQTR